MSQVISPSVRRPYGLARVARCWKLSRATLYRRRGAPAGPKRRPGPLGPCDDATLVMHIKRAIAGTRFTGEGYRKIWARLRFAGIRTSPGRTRRLMGRMICSPRTVGVHGRASSMTAPSPPRPWT